jgi:hypothetical protein
MGKNKKDTIDQGTAWFNAYVKNIQVCYEQRIVNISFLPGFTSPQIRIR